MFRHIVILLLAAGAAAGAEGDAFLGTWMTQEGLSKVEIKRCGDRLCGAIVWLKPVQGEDTAQRKRPPVGTQILSDFKADGTGGKVHAPERGRTMDGRMSTAGSDGLEIKVSAGVMKRTVKWTRAR